MTNVIGVPSGTHVPLHKRLDHQLGYNPAIYIHHPPRAAAYVLRTCMGCGRRLEFTPMPGITRLSYCVTCGETTSWVLVGPRL